jgi:Skp family chaperone for outer membrane proteins
MQELQAKLVAPVFKEMEAIIEEIGEEKGFSLILDSRAGVLYLDPTMDISDLVVQELNKRLADTKKTE